MIRGNVNASDEEYVAEVELYIDGQLAETAQLPASFAKRRYELFWKYRLTEGNIPSLSNGLIPSRESPYR